MKNRILLICLTAFFVGGSVLFFANNGVIKSQKKYSPRVAKVSDEDFNGALAYLKILRNNQITGEIAPMDLINAKKQVDAMAKSKTKGALGLNWIEMGPNNVGGRTRAILVDKDNSNIVYAGGVAGGLWKSTSGGSSWTQIPTMADNFAIASIAQGPNGEIYVGTGEGLAFNGMEGNINGGTAFVGNGIYKSTDGTTFTQLTATNPVANSTNVEWACINRLAVNQATGRVFAATNRGIRISDDGGTTWSNPVTTTFGGTALVVATATDVEVASDGSVSVAAGNKCYTSPTGTFSTFTSQSTGAAGKLPSTGLARIELAVAPSNPNYIYCSAAAADGSLKNVYRSTDKGETWSVIGPGGSTSFVPFGDQKQGWYDNTIAVFPNDPDHVIMGGIDMWEWENGGNWTQKTLWNLNPLNYMYIHADQHIYTFPKNNSDVIYVGSDGGISKSINGGYTWQTMNINYNVTQFYAVACAGNGAVMGGTQDNGTQYLSLALAPPQDMNAEHIFGGDGGWAAFSNVNPDAFFATTYYGATGRSANAGASFSTYQTFLSARMIAALIGTSGAAFVTPLLLWESNNDIFTNDLTVYTDTSDHNIGETVTVSSKNNAYPFQYTLDSNYSKGDTIYVKDIVQTKFFLGANNAVWMTRRPLDFSITPKWNKICSFSGTTQTMSVSRDGNYLFAGTQSGGLIRVSNLRYATGSTFASDSLACEWNSPFCVIESKLLTTLPSAGRPVTSIAIDPSNSSHIVVTLGSYGNSIYVYESNNALDLSPTFTAKQGNLPAMPVYSSLIPMNTTHTVILGTEYGIYTSDDFDTGPTWTQENTGAMSHVPVYMIRQQLDDFPYINQYYPGVNNWGMIYLATHGRGIFKCDKYVGINENPGSLTSDKPVLNLFPNPVVDNANVEFNLAKPEKVLVRIFDMSGRVVKSIDFTQLASGYHQIKVDCSLLTKGTYIFNLAAGSKSTSAKFVMN